MGLRLFGSVWRRRTSAVLLGCLCGLLPAGVHLDQAAAATGAVVVQATYHDFAIQPGSVSLAFPSSVTKGDVIVVLCQAGSLPAAATTISASDTQGNTYTNNVQAGPASFGFFEAVLSATAVTTGADTVTCTESQPHPSWMKLGILEVSGISPTGVTTGVGSSPSPGDMSTSSVPYSSGALLVAIGNDAFSFESGGCGVTPGFTPLVAGNDTQAEYAVASSSSSTTFPVACPGGTQYAEAGAQFPASVPDTDLGLTNVPANITTNATSPSGAVVTYSAPSVVDEEAGASVACNPSSGSTFPIGVTTVHCSVTDTDDTPSTASASFTVEVKGASGQITDTMGQVSALPVPTGEKNGLNAILKFAQNQLSLGHTRVACAALNAFIIAVQVAEHAPPPFQVPAAAGAALVQDAQRIRAVAAC